MVQAQFSLFLTFLVMSFPAEGVELGFRNHIEDVRTFLDSRHPDHYTVFNLSPKYYRSAKFHNRVSISSKGWIAVGGN